MHMNKQSFFIILLTCLSLQFWQLPGITKQAFIKFICVRFTTQIWLFLKRRTQQFNNVIGTRIPPDVIHVINRIVKIFFGVKKIVRSS